MWFDDEVVELVASAIPLWLAVGLLLMAYLGSVYVLAPATILGYLTDRSGRRTWPGAILLAYGTFVLLKPLTAVPRPAVDSALRRELFPGATMVLYEYGMSFSSGSFPSGHLVAATVFGALVIADCRFGTIRQRIAAVAGFVTIIAITRIGLAMHYLGDIVGGILIGGAVVGVVFGARRTVRSPSSVLLALATVSALGAIVLSRPEDGVVLLLAIGAFALFEGLTRVDVMTHDRGSNPRRLTSPEGEMNRSDHRRGGRLARILVRFLR